MSKHLIIIETPEQFEEIAKYIDKLKLLPEPTYTKAYTANLWNQYKNGLNKNDQIAVSINTETKHVDYCKLSWYLKSSTFKEYTAISFDKFFSKYVFKPKISIMEVYNGH